MSVQSISDRSREFSRKLRRYCLGLVFSVLILAGLGTSAMISERATDRFLGGGIITVALFLLYEIYVRWPGSELEFRTRLERQRHQHRSAWLW